MSKRKSGQRTKTGRLSRSKLALAERNPPADHILERRNLFSFVTPTKGPDGRVGEIDQDICDGIGQLHALGLLDGHGIDPTELRDKGRDWRNHYCLLLRRSGFKTGSYERMDRAKSDSNPEYTRADIIFDRMDEALGNGVERAALLSLLVDPIMGSWPLGEENAPWAQSLIDEELRARKRFRKGVIRFPDMNDRAMLEACVRGLCLIFDGGMELRRAA